MKMKFLDIFNGDSQEVKYVNGSFLFEINIWKRVVNKFMCDLKIN